jgi:hypothetical protein
VTIRELLAMADGHQPIPTEKVDVRVHCAVCGESNHQPLRRRLTRVVRQTMAGEPWLYWYWTPEPTGDVNGIDCGYSGRRLDA